MIPERLSSPTVGLIPTRPLTDDGHVTEPSVSVPTAAAQRFAAAAAPDPELEPHGLRSSAYGLREPAAPAPAASGMARSKVRPFAEIGLAEKHRARLAK